ncbi:MAG TPA: hypothetical protein VGB95_07605 [Chitinophagales bacterium]
MEQQYDRYTAEDHEVWRILFERQVKNLADKSCTLHLQTLNEMREVLYAEKIPDFTALNAFLLGKTGWQIQVVKGLIPVDEFFDLLADKKFPSSTWLRTRAQLDYLEEPDMFHDIFGHIPLFADAEYADLMQKIGLFSRANNHETELTNQLERFYWFTIEFGLMRENASINSATKGQKIYGAGIISSFGESNSIYETVVKIKPFNLGEVIHHSFIKSEMQPEYFYVQSISQVRDELEKLIRLKKK